MGSVQTVATTTSPRTLPADDVGIRGQMRVARQPVRPGLDASALETSEACHTSSTGYAPTAESRTIGMAEQSAGGVASSAKSNL